MAREEKEHRVETGSEFLAGFLDDLGERLIYLKISKKNEIFGVLFWPTKLLDYYNVTYSSESGCCGHIDWSVAQNLYQR